MGLRKSWTPCSLNEFLAWWWYRIRQKLSNNNNFTLKLPPLAFIHSSIPLKRSFPEKSLSRDPWPYSSSASQLCWSNKINIHTLSEPFMPRLVRRNRFLLLSHLLDALCECERRSQTVGRLERTRRSQRASPSTQKERSWGREREIVTRAGFGSFSGSEQL